MQIHERNSRNTNGECGLAYYWGNAYHSRISGKAPGLDELVSVLQRYLQSHKKEKLLELFEKNPNILAEYGYPHPIHINRIIAGVLCKENVIYPYHNTIGIHKVSNRRTNRYLLVVTSICFVSQS